MPKPKHVILVALAALVLGACSSAAAPTEPPVPTDTQAAPTEVQPTSTPTEAATESPRATATEVVEATATKAEATATQEPEKQEPTATAESQSAVVTPEPTEDVFSFLQVGPDEWARGSADAPVTIIEYADFQ